VIGTVVVLADSGGSSPGSQQTLHKHRRTAAIAPFKRVPPGPPSDQRRLSLLKTIGGHISPK